MKERSELIYAEVLNSPYGCINAVYTRKTAGKNILTYGLQLLFPLPQFFNETGHLQKCQCTTEGYNE